MQIISSEPNSPEIQPHEYYVKQQQQSQEKAIVRRSYEKLVQTKLLKKQSKSTDLTEKVVDVNDEKQGGELISRNELLKKNNNNNT